MLYVLLRAPRLYSLQNKKLPRTYAPLRILRKVAIGRNSIFRLVHLSLSTGEFRKRLLSIPRLSRRDLSNQSIDRFYSDTVFNKVCRRRYLAIC